jgi:hypothetical protein
VKEKRNEVVRRAAEILAEIGNDKHFAELIVLSEKMKKTEESGVVRDAVENSLKRLRARFLGK